MVETSSTDRHRSLIFSALRYVRSLRVRSSGESRPVRGPTGNLNTMIEFGPKLRSTPATDSSKPVRMALTPMIVPVPMITPRTVRKARSLCVRIVWIASTIPFANASLVILFLRPQRFDRVEFRRLARRVDPEEQPDRRRQTDPNRDRSIRERHRDGGRVADQNGHGPGDHYTD